MSITAPPPPSRTCPACALGGERRHEQWCRVEAVVLLAITEETGVVVVLDIERRLDIDIHDADLRACVTVGDLARAAERAMAGRAGR